MRGELRISLVIKPKAEMLGPGEHEAAAGFAEKRDAACANGVAGNFPEGVSQNSLCDQLDQQVERGRDRQVRGQIARGTVQSRIFHLAAGDAARLQSRRKAKSRISTLLAQASGAARLSPGHLLA